MKNKKLSSPKNVTVERKDAGYSSGPLTACSCGFESYVQSVWDGRGEQ